MSEHIRVIHTADLHIGTQNYGRPDAGTGMHSRLLDFLKSLDSLVDYAISNDADIVLICGDVFKSREPDVTQQREFAKRVKKLSVSGIKVYILVGNHDLHSAAGKATSVEIYDVLGLEGVYIRKIPGVDLIETKRGAVQIAALPYTPPGNLSSEGMSIEDVAVDARRKLDALAVFLAEKLNAGVPAVLASHFSIIGAAAGAERSIMLGREVTLPAALFARPEYEYVAMGHIHKHQAIGLLPPVVYSGSIDRVDYSEEKEDKGFVDVRIKKGETSYEFIKIDTRPFKTIYIDGLDGDPFEKALIAIDNVDLKDAVVKLKVKLGAGGLPRLNENELYKLLRQRAFFVAGIEKDMVYDSSHLRHPGITERMDFKQALEEYIEKKEGYAGMRQELLRANRLILDELSEEGVV